MTAGEYRNRYEERLAAWAAVFPPPPEYFGIPNVPAERLTLLELALDELRKVGRPIPEPARRAVLARVMDLMDVFGSIDLETAR